MQFSGMNNELTWDAIVHARKLHCVYPSSPPLIYLHVYMFFWKHMHLFFCSVHIALNLHIKAKNNRNRTLK